MSRSIRKISLPWRRFSIGPGGPHRTLHWWIDFRGRRVIPDLVTLAAAQPESGAAVDAIKVLYARGQERLLTAALRGPDVEARRRWPRAGQRRRSTGSRRCSRPWSTIRMRLRAVAQEAAKALGKTRHGARELLRRIRQDTLPPELKQAVAFALQTTPFDDIA